MTAKKLPFTLLPKVGKESPKLPKRVRFLYSVPRGGDVKKPTTQDVYEELLKVHKHEHKNRDRFQEIEEEIMALGERSTQAFADLNAAVVELAARFGSGNGDLEAEVAALTAHVAEQDAKIAELEARDLGASDEEVAGAVEPVTARVNEIGI